MIKMAYYDNYRGYGDPSYQAPPGYTLVRNPSYQTPFTQQRLPSGGTGSIPGRTVQSPDEIMPSEVPSNGGLALFPRYDYMEIYAKQVNTNGMIDMVTYVPKGSQQAQAPQPQAAPVQNGVSPEALNALASRLDKIENLLARLNSLWESPKPASEEAK